MSKLKMVGVARTSSPDGSTSVLWLTVTRSCPFAVCSGEKVVHMYLHLTAGPGPVTPSQWYVCCRAQEYQNTSSFLLPIFCFCLLQVALARPRRVGRETSADTQERATPGFWEEHLPGERHHQCTHLCQGMPLKGTASYTVEVGCCTCLKNRKVNS